MHSAITGNMAASESQFSFLLWLDCYFHSTVFRKTQAFNVLHSYNKTG